MKKVIKIPPYNRVSKVIAFLSGLVSGIIIGQKNCPRFPWNNDIPKKEEEKSDK